MKILFIGLGGIGQRHLRNIKELYGESVEIFAYRKINLSHVINDKLEVIAGQNLYDTYGIKPFNSLEDALSQRPDVAIICNPTSLHLETAEKCIIAGCNVFIEKALSNSLEGVTRLIKLAEKQKVISMVRYQMRFHPLIKRLKEIIETDLLGNTIFANASVGEYLPNWHKYEDYRLSYASRKDLGGGVIISQIHEFDYLQWIFGPPKTVYTIGGKLSDLEINVEDVACTLMECNVRGAIIPIFVHQDYIQKTTERGCSVVGTKGRIVIDLANSTLLRYGLTGEEVEKVVLADFKRNQLFLDEISFFIESVRNKVEVSTSLKEGAISLQIALAAKKSLYTKKIVRVADIENSIFK